MKDNKNKGFTLIELLIVVMLIGVLSGVVISIVNAGGFRAKARDAQRIADLEKIRSALELYFADNRYYPVSDGSWLNIAADGNVLVTSLESEYLNKVPVDPSQNGLNGGPCNGTTTYRYNYRTGGGGSAYVLTAIMEIVESNDGNECDQLSNITGGAVGGCAAWSTADYCYGVQNP